MRQRNLFGATKPRAVRLQIWQDHAEPFKAFVILAKTGRKPVDLARFLVIELGADIGSTGLGSCAMYTDLPWQ